MADEPPGRELCPYCRRPFKRLRRHLPHCKAAPSTAPGSAHSPAAPGSGSVPSATGSASVTAGIPLARGGSGSVTAGIPVPRGGSGSGTAGIPVPRGGSGSGTAGIPVPRGGSGSATAGTPIPRGGSGSATAGTPIPRGGSGSVTAVPTAKPGSGSKARAGKSSKRPPSPSVGQGKVAASEQSGGFSPSLPRQPESRKAERNVEPSVEDVARSLDLLPEEVKEIPEKLNNGVKIVIEKHRARVVRKQSGSWSTGGTAGSHSVDQGPKEGLKPGSAAGHTAQSGPREKITVPDVANTETRGPGAAENVSVSSRGEKGGSSKARKIDVLGDPPETDCRSSPADLAQQEGIEKTVTEEKQMYLEVGAEYKAPLSALHTKSLHLSAMEGFGGHKEGTSKHYLTSIQKLRESMKQMAAVSEPILDARRDTELALDQFSLHTSKSQPICLSQASGRSAPAGAVGLEWFPDLYPSYDGLSIFLGKPFQEDVGIITKAPKGNFSEGQLGPLSERHLMDVRLGELPAWLAIRDISPQGLLGGVRKAWSNYCDKYINVRRGGPAGISMLLAGYCLLSYSWNYQHIKCHRWRKYH